MAADTVQWLFQTLIFVVLSSSLALAEERTRVRLGFENAQVIKNCPSIGEIEQKFNTLAGYEAVWADAKDTITLKVEPGTEGVKGVIDTTLGQGSRTLTSRSAECAGIIDALVLSAVMLLDEFSGENAFKPKPLPPPIKPAAPAPEVSSRTSKVDVAASVALRIGSAPAVAVGGVVSIGLRLKHALFAVEFRGDAPSEKSVLGTPLSISYFGGAAVGCGAVSIIYMCGVIHAGARLAYAQGLEGGSSQPRPYIGLGPRIAIDVFKYKELGARLGGELLFAPVLTRYTISDTTAWVTPVVQFGIGASFFWSR